MPKSFILSLRFVFVELGLLLISAVCSFINMDIVRILVIIDCIVMIVHLSAMMYSMNRIRNAIENRDMESVSHAFSNMENMINESKTDNVTGCFNRSYFEIVRGKYKNYSSLLVAFFDVNNLKTANDIYGHECGDLLLKSVSEILRELDTIGDIYRWGGDEFIFIANDNVDAQTRLTEWHTNLMENPRTIEFTNPKTNEAEELPITFAMGISYREVGKKYSIEDLVREADSKMYEQKKRMKGV